MEVKARIVVVVWWDVRDVVWWIGSWSAKSWIRCYQIVIVTWSSCRSKYYQVVVWSWTC